MDYLIYPNVYDRKKKKKKNKYKDELDIYHRKKNTLRDHVGYSLSFLKKKKKEKEATPDASIFVIGVELALVLHACNGPARLHTRTNLM